MLVKPEVQNFAKIKVIGVGGAGCSAVKSMAGSENIKNVEFVAISVDSQSPSRYKSLTKLQIGKKITNGLGSGATPTIGKECAEESTDEIRKVLEGSNMVFITAGMGGGTGTGASPIVAKIAKELGILTVAVVTTPFGFEGAKRMKTAEAGISNLQTEVDALIVIPSQKILETTEKDISIVDAFKLSNSVLSTGVQGLSDLIVTHGKLVNVDFADVKTIMTNSGSAMIGTAIAKGENRAEKCAKESITSQLLGDSIDDATGILINIIGDKNLTLHEVNDAVKIISKKASPDAEIIFGATIDEQLEDEIKIVVIATGFNNQNNKNNNPPPQTENSFDNNQLDIPAFLRNR